MLCPSAQLYRVPEHGSVFKMNHGEALGVQLLRDVTEGQTHALEGSTNPHSLEVGLTFSPEN